MEEKKFICIICPKGCEISVSMENHKIISINGNTCLRGKKYVSDEAISPKRLIFTTVKLNNGQTKMLPVRTKESIPKKLVRPAMKLLSNVSIDAPIKMGDIIVKNILDTGIDVIASKNADKVN